MSSPEIQLKMFQACEQKLAPLFIDTAGLFLGFFCQGEEKKVGITHVIDEERKREQAWEKQRGPKLLEIGKQFASSVYQGPQEGYFEAKTRVLLQEEVKLLHKGELAERFDLKYYKGFIDPQVQDRWLEVLLNDLGIYGAKRDEEKKTVLQYSDFDLFNANVTVGGEGGGRTCLGKFSEQVLMTLKKSAQDLVAKKKEGVELSENERQILIRDKYIDCHGFLQTLIHNLKTEFNGQQEASISTLDSIAPRLELYKERIKEISHEQNFFEKLTSPKKEGKARDAQMPSELDRANSENFFIVGRQFCLALSEFIKFLDERESKDVHDNVKVLAGLKTVATSTEAASPLAAKVAHYRIFRSYKETFKRVHELFGSIFQQK